MLAYFPASEKKRPKSLRIEWGQSHHKEQATYAHTSAQTLA